MKILLITDQYPPNVIGGAELMAARCAQALSRRGHEVVVCTCVEDESLVGEDHAGGTTIIRGYVPRCHERWNQWRALFSFRGIRLAWKVAREFRPNVAYVHNINRSFSFFVLLAIRPYVGSVAYHAHDVMAVSAGKMYPEDIGAQSSFMKDLLMYGPRYNPFLRPLARKMLNSADRVIAVSRALASILEQAGIRRVVVVHNGIEPKASAADISLLREIDKTHGLAGKRIILFAGRLFNSKGIHLIPLIAEELKDLRESVGFLIVGRRTKHVDRVFEDMSERGMGDMVRYAGWLDGRQLSVAFQRADVVLVLSVCVDAFAIVNIEAMAAGKPVIGTIFGGTPEIVIDGETGFLVDPRDVRGVAERIRLLLEDPDLRRRMGAAGRQRVEEHFSLDEKVIQIERLLLSTSRRGS